MANIQYKRTIIVTAIGTLATFFLLAAVRQVNPTVADRARVLTDYKDIYERAVNDQESN